MLFLSFFEWAGLAGCWLPRHRRVISLELRSLLMLTFPAVVFLTAGAPVKGLCHWNPVMPWQCRSLKYTWWDPFCFLARARIHFWWNGCGMMWIRMASLCADPMWPSNEGHAIFRFSDPRSFSALRFCCHTGWMRIFGCWWHWTHEATDLGDVPGDAQALSGLVKTPRPQNFRGNPGIAASTHPQIFQT